MREANGMFGLHRPRLCAGRRRFACRRGVPRARALLAVAALCFALPPSSLAEPLCARTTAGNASVARLIEDAKRGPQMAPAIPSLARAASPRHERKSCLAAPLPYPVSPVAPAQKPDEAQAAAPKPASVPLFPFHARAAAFQDLIEATARARGIQAALLDAVVAVESGFDPTARSPAGALGLMQLMPGTAARYGVTDLKDPAQNLDAGARHLRYLLAEFDHNLKLALAAYNAGEYAVRRHSNTVPPYPETRTYVERVLRFYHQRLSDLVPGPL